MTSAVQPPSEGAKTAQRSTATAGIGATVPTPGVGCGRCDARWGGLNTSHCSGCHRTFSGITAFDKHRTGSPHPAGTRTCQEPAAAGLVLLSRRYECWGFDGDGADFWADAS